MMCILIEHFQLGLTQQLKRGETEKQELLQPNLNLMLKLPNTKKKYINFDEKKTVI